MPQVNQDFMTFKGDAITPQFTVLGADNVTPVDISQVSNIQWSAQRNLNDPVVLTKTKTGSGISFVTNGTDGKFQVALLPADTSALSGWYVHTAALTDSSGNITTVTVGRMNVGQAPNWTYDDNTSAIEDIYLVRDMIGDVIQSDQQLSDQTIFNSLARYDTQDLAAAECCRFIAAKYARQVDVVTGTLKTNYSNRYKSYMALAANLEARGHAHSVGAYTGGISIGDKQTVAADTDRVPPQFVLGMFDDLLPESPVGHQTNAAMGVGIDASTDLTGTDIT